MSKERRGIVVFHCNWAGRHTLDEIGRRKARYPTDVVPMQVSCLGRMHAGLVLKALEAGAVGVLMLGCPEDECRFGTDGAWVARVHAEAVQLARLLGFQEEQVRLERVGPQDRERVRRVLSELADAASLLDSGGDGGAGLASGDGGEGSAQG